MIAGVALSTCGFSVGFLVYVLKIERFKPLMKPAILVAFLGYGSSCAALLFDIGLPHRFWHPFVFWNLTSFLFEVFWCVILYFTVTVLELSPSILEKYKIEKLAHKLHKASPVIVIIGISLSSLHHSSLGSLFLTAPLRLHELWYTPWIPLMFIISAIGGGMFFLIIAKMFYARFYDPESVFGKDFFSEGQNVCSLDGTPVKMKTKIFGEDMNMLGGLAVIASWIMGIYLVLKIYDLFASGSINSLLSGTWESWFYIVELALTAIVPIILVSIRKVRKSPRGLGLAALSGAFGVVFNRLNAGLFGFFRDASDVYIPSLAEIALSAGVVAAAALAFLYISSNFTIFDEHWKERTVDKGIFRSAFDSISRVWLSVLHNGLYRVSLIGIVVLPVAFVFMYPPYGNDTDDTIKPAAGVDTERKVLLIDGNSSGVKAVFAHADHQERLGGKQSCTSCHHINMPNDNSTPCYRCHTSMTEKTKIFDHSYHTIAVAEDKGIGGLHPENNSCNICHSKNEAKTPYNTIKCEECHEQDMNLSADMMKNLNFLYASGYMDAMHGTCVKCHEKNDKMMDPIAKRKLSDCSTCHKENESTKLSAR